MTEVTPPALLSQPLVATDESPNTGASVSEADTAPISRKTGNEAAASGGVVAGSQKPTTVGQSKSTTPTTTAEPGSPRSTESQITDSLSHPTPSDEGSGASSTPRASVSPAEAGGIAVGAAVAGIFLTILVVICYRSLKRRRRRGQTFSKRIHAPVEETIVYRHLDILDRLPQRIADEDYRQKLKKLRTDIKNCVDSFFVTEHITINSTEETRLLSLAGPPAGGSTWSLNLTDDDLRPRFTRLLLAQILFSAMNPSCNFETTLLPAQLLAVYQNLQTSTRQQHPKHGFELGSESRKDILALWRQISGHVVPLDVVSQQIHQRIGPIASALSPLRPRSSEDFFRILEGLLKDASDLALELFTSPDEWEAVWTSSRQDEEGGVVVFPALLFHRCLNNQEKGSDETIEKIYLSRCVVEH